MRSMTPFCLSLCPPTVAFVWLATSLVAEPEPEHVPKPELWSRLTVTGVLATPHLRMIEPCIRYMYMRYGRPQNQGLLIIPSARASSSIPEIRNVEVALSYQWAHLVFIPHLDKRGRYEYGPSLPGSSYQRLSSGLRRMTASPLSLPALRLSHQPSAV